MVGDKSLETAMKEVILIAANREVSRFIKEVRPDLEYTEPQTVEEALSTCKNAATAIIDEKFNNGRGKELAFLLKGKVKRIILLKDTAEEEDPEIQVLEKPFSREDIEELLGESPEEDVIDLAEYTKEKKLAREKAEEVAKVVKSFEDLFMETGKEKTPDVEKLSKELIEKLKDFIEAIVEMKIEELLRRKNQD